ncbi:hypothetical protein [Pseudosulfitobacter sp. DSM 107133]|uniref:hypothetical protein n=1 Tax=Pseudosulfitobacter sp. DSM 107133 TaxID=2883100 RepID=UPI000DF2E0B3|nr:hypothetical protein [Pseudosulfitobacter sp. DSM 107133]
MTRCALATQALFVAGVLLPLFLVAGLIPALAPVGDGRDDSGLHVLRIDPDPPHRARYRSGDYPRAEHPAGSGTDLPAAADGTRAHFSNAGRSGRGHGATLGWVAALTLACGAFLALIKQAPGAFPLLISVFWFGWTMLALSVLGAACIYIEANRAKD